MNAPAPNAPTPDRLNHAAFCTGNMKEQLAFFTKVIGMELKALFWMHGVKGAFHAFLEMKDKSSMSFVYHPDVEDKPVVMGSSHVPNTISLVPGGVHQHIAFNMEDETELADMVKRIRSFGYMITDIVDHEFCKSAYMLAPENLWIEFTTNVMEFREMDIDQEVVGLCGISAEELAVMRAPNAKIDTSEDESLKPKEQHALMQQRMVEMIEQMQKW